MDKLYSMIEDWKVIVSTKSGGGKAAQDWPKIAALLDAKNIKYSAVFTERRYHAMDLASKAIAEGYRKIVCVGGDGAVHEALNGVCSQKEVPSDEVTLAIIPVGSGNDWARLHNIPRDYAKDVEIIAAENTVYQDVALVNSVFKGHSYKRYMINIGGLGFDANVCHHFDKLKIKGKATERQYYNCVVKGFLGYSNRRFKVIADGEVIYEGDVFSVALGIGKYSGGGMLQTPAAVYDDGLTDVTVIKRMPKLKILVHLKKLFKGNIYNIREVIHTKAKVLVIQAWPASRVEVDGEYSGESPILVETIPHAIKAIRNNLT